MSIGTQYEYPFCLEIEAYGGSGGKILVEGDAVMELDYSRPAFGVRCIEMTGGAVINATHPDMLMRLLYQRIAATLEDNVNAQRWFMGRVEEDA